MSFKIPAAAMLLVGNLTISAFAAEHTKDAIADVQRRIEKKEAVLIDVREESEWKAGHLRAASLVPLSGLVSEAQRGSLVEKLPKDKIIYCHCRSGGRVLKATDILSKLGYDIRPLKLGYGDLLKEGFEKAPDDEKGKPAETSSKP